MPHTKEDISPRRPAWFWWALANLLALCFAVTSWVLALEIFGRPDVPHNYQLLLRMDRAPEFKSYSPKGAPDGRLLTPPEVYGWFFDMGDKGHAKLNSLYRRNYMRNFDEAYEVTYVEGDFRVLATRGFGESDFLPEGIAVRARAMVKPDDFSAAAPYPVIVELMLPMVDPGLSERFAKGSVFTLEKAAHLPVVMHVQRHVEADEPAILVTVIPIRMGSLQLRPGGWVAFAPPAWVRPEGKMPLFEPGTGVE